MFQPTRIVMTHAPECGMDGGQRDDRLVIRVP
jgi:hypothetical protein